jgi:hypothetical protein
MLTYEEWLKANNESGETNEVSLEDYYWRYESRAGEVDLQKYMDDEYEAYVTKWEAENWGRMLLKMKEQARLSREAREAVEARKKPARYPLPW